jgi:hypothetical protein
MFTLHSNTGQIKRLELEAQRGHPRHPNCLSRPMACGQVYNCECTQVGHG